jgi:hypothetical protein
MKEKGSLGAVYLAIAKTADRHRKKAAMTRSRSRLKWGEQRTHNSASAGKVTFFVLIGSPQAEQNRVRRIARSPGRKMPTRASIDISGRG